MKVLCINDSGWMVRISSFFGFGGHWFKGLGPVFGDIDVVIKEEQGDGGKLFYFLQNWPGGQYEANEFIPLSDIDETLFERKSIVKTTIWPLDKALKTAK